MRAEPGKGFEPWAWGAFALVAVTLGLFVFLGLRPGGAAPVLVYRHGILWAGWTCAVAMLLGLVRCLRRRPALQRGRVWPLGALGASLYLCSLPIAYPSSHRERYSTTRFRLPFEGVARVRSGGERVRYNPLLFQPARCYGTGFERTDGAPLVAVAPAGGTLLDRRPGRSGELLVIETAAGEFCVLDGVEPTGPGPVPGGRIERGEPLGTVPGILTVHLQDRAEPDEGEGVPMRYFDYLADGRHVHAGVPIPPQEVVNAAPGEDQDSVGR